jgi:hypothetical protein
VQGRHRGERIPAEETIERAPVGLPELLAVLVHHAPQLGGPAVVHPPARGGVPGRRGRHRPVADQAEVERRVQQRRAARELIAVAQEQERRGAVRDEEPDPVRPDQRPLDGVDPPGRPNARCSRSVGVIPPPISLSTLTGIVDPHPPLELERVVVRHLVRGDVGPHLQADHRHVAFPRAGDEDAERERRRRSRRRDDRRREPQTAPHERRRKACGERRARHQADGGRPAHSGRG